MLDPLAIILLTCIFLIVLMVLVIERSRHKKLLNQIPCRITVTGTRGKSTTVRLITSILREAGYEVLGKVTGTEAVYLLPDGREETIARRGGVNIIEQKKLVKKAARLGVDYLVCEIMSIQNENHQVETKQLLQPHHVILTNLYPDHLDDPKQNMLERYAHDLYPGAKLFLPEVLKDNQLVKLVKAKDMQIRCIPTADGPAQPKDLASGFMRWLGIAEANIREGINKTAADLGSLTAYRFNGKQGPVVMVNAFAANDPQSSQRVLDLIAGLPEFKDYQIKGLLAFRADRGERSQQWLEYLMADQLGAVKDWLYLGRAARVFKRKLKKGEILHENSTPQIQTQLMEHLDQPCLMFGMMNIGGWGRELVKYWEQHGEKLNFQV